jgi:membrane protein YqaA with SNARE-associated domain
MGNVELFSLLATDSFVAALIIPPFHPVIYSAMKIFGGYNNLLIYFIISISYIAAGMLNYLFGYMLLFLPSLKEQFLHNKNYIKYNRYLTKYFFWLPILTFLPSFGATIGVACGFLNLSLKRYALFVTMGNLLYFAFDLWLKNMIM